MSLPFEIRRATETDIPQILTFIKALAAYERMADKVVATEQSLKESLFDRHQADVIFALENGQPVGFALFYQTYSTFQGAASLFLEDLYIEPPYRNKGYGKKLFAYLADVAQERHLNRIDWWVLDWNQPARDFYHQMGAQSLDGWIIYRLENKNLLSLSLSKKD